LENKVLDIVDARCNHEINCSISSVSIQISLSRY